MTLTLKSCCACYSPLYSGHCLSEVKQLVWTEIARRRPRFIFTCAPCTWYSTLNTMWNIPHMETIDIQRKKAEADDLFDFSMEVCQHQIDVGRLFGHEHPRLACSWDKASCRRVSQAQSVGLAHFDQCMFGLKSPMGFPMKKSTTLMSNSNIMIADFNGVICDHSHTHLQIQGT